MRPVSFSFSQKFMPLILNGRQAVDTFLQSPQCEDIKHLKLFDKEWDVLVDVAHVLMVSRNIFKAVQLTNFSQCPHQVQMMLSKDKTPVLAGVIPAMEIFLTKWEKLALAKPHLKPWIDVGLTWATKYYRRLDSSNAYVIAMCKFHFTLKEYTLKYSLLVINPSIRFSWIQKNWEDKYKKCAMATIKKLVSYFLNLNTRRCTAL
jgi:hypothetical protein